MENIHGNVINGYQNGYFIIAAGWTSYFKNGDYTIVKRLYSVILLFSFLVGTLQPALPLIEYHLFKGSIIQKFCIDRDEPVNDCEGSCYLANQIAQSEGQEDYMILLNLEFYPIAISIAPLETLFTTYGRGSMYSLQVLSLPDPPLDSVHPPPRNLHG
ncbi:MAG: hypothetical protein WD315_05335 [Balneolaceae bacterium]